MSDRSILRFLLFHLALAGAALAQAAPATVRIEPRLTARTLVAEATIEAVHEVTLAAQVPGRIVALNVDAGDRVTKGEVLLRIDAAEATQAVAGAEAGIAQAQANLVNARAAFERTSRLLERKFVSPAALDQAKAAYKAAEAQLRAARAGRGQAGVAQGYATLVSPLTGLVAARHVERGEMAQPGAALLTVYDPAAMRAVVDVPQNRIGVGTLRSARVELPESGRWFDATAITALPAADPRTHTVRVRVDLPASADGLVPGTFARVHFATGDEQRIAVPASAVLRRGEITAVYVADGAAVGGFRLRQIRAGEPLPDGAVEVLAGLNGGEEVALDPVQAGIASRVAAQPAKR